MAFLAAYLDESFTTKSDLVVAGYVAPIEAWAGFATSWRECLDEFKLPYFHMKEFRNGHSRIFKHLSGPEKRELFARLLTITVRTASFGVSVRLDPALYKSEVSRRKSPNVFGSGYSVAVSACCYLMNKRLSETDAETVDVTLEDGHKNAVEAIGELSYHKKISEVPEAPNPADYGVDEIRIIEGEVRQQSPNVTLGHIGLATKRERVPLQSADILAYSTLRAPFDGPSAVVLNILKSSVPHVEAEVNAESIRKYIAVVEDNEIRRADRKHQIHELRRFFGWAGIKVKTVPGGILIDSRDTKTFEESDIARMLEADPAITLTRHGKESDPE